MTERINFIVDEKCNEILKKLDEMNAKLDEWQVRLDDAGFPRRAYIIKDGKRIRDGFQT